MFWGYKLRDTAKARFAKEIAEGKPLIIRDEKTMSGRVHVGSLRGVAIHGIVSEVLKDAGIANRFLFEINDFDPMDGLPVYLDQELYKPYMGRLLYEVPSPEPSAPNYAEYWAQEFISVVEHAGFTPEYYRSSILYLGGKYNNAIRLALDNAEKIRVIYKEVSGSEKGSDWFPLQVVCENCRKVGTTKVTAWDGKVVSYICLPDLVKWGVGCGHEGKVDPFDGRAKLPWKVEWAAKFMVLGVHMEGGGKDHYTKGGSRDIARRILKEIFQYPEPIDIPYNFFVIGGAKMSSSKGKGSSAKEIADLLPTQMLRFLMMKEPKHEIDFEPYGDTIPILYDHYDTIAGEYFSNAESEWSKVFPLFQPAAKRAVLMQAFLPRFSQIAYLVQMPHINIADKVAAIKGAALNDADTLEYQERAAYAKQWLGKYSPDKYKFEIQESAPDEAKNFSLQQKNALKQIREYILENENLIGEQLHSQIHEIKKALNIAPAELFSSLYISFLGKDSGPQAGWFLSALDRDFVIRRLGEVASVIDDATQPSNDPYGSDQSGVSN
jgi:lysyl-tRNA synthetase class 1